MSYDLQFDRVEPLTETEFFGYFLGRCNYTRQNRQAWYSNEGTGVYFSFLIAGPSDQQESGKPFLGSFKINLYRPHFFGLEAAPEVVAFTEHFELTVTDPQEKDGETFSGERFLNNWFRSNLFGHKALLNAEKTLAKINARPSAQLEAIWRWNYEVPRIQAELGENVFVPSIIWISISDGLNSAAVWPDGIATLIPAVEMIIIPRDAMAPTTLRSREKGLCLIEQRALDECLAPMKVEKYPLPCRIPSYLSPPEQVEQFVRRLLPEQRQINRISMDQVLDAETVAAATANASQ